MKYELYQYGALAQQGFVVNRYLKIKLEILTAFVRFADMHTDCVYF